MIVWSYFFFINADGKRQRSPGPNRGSGPGLHRHQGGGYYRPGTNCKPRKNCRLSRWCAWSSCSATCGPSGVKSRTRHIIENAQCGGRCSALRQVRRCNRRCLNGGYMRYGRCKCRTSYSGCCCEGAAVDGQWSAWSQWCRCSKTCGMGYRSRVRHCDNPPPSNGGKGCLGRHVEHKKCYEPACPVDGRWGPWTFWSRCSESCGDGQQLRSRRCNSPPPSNGGNDCTGASTERRPCNDRQCPVDGGWSNWGPWCQCSATCGPGSKSRKRHCNNPPPLNGGRNCVGGHVEHAKCNIKPCHQLSYYPKGCYRDKHDRAMPEFMGNFKGHDNPVKWCVETVLRHHYKAFGVQYGGECWSGARAHLTYNKHGKANTCRNGLGYHWANSVYFIGAPSPQPAATTPTEAPVTTQSPATTSTNPPPLTTEPPPPGLVRVTTQTPSDCWSDWSEWSGCSAKCGCGHDARVRYCKCGSGEHGSCSGPSEKTRQCNCQSCA